MRRVGQPAQTERVTGIGIGRTYVDRGYRGHGADKARVILSGQKRSITPTMRQERQRHNAIEPVIGRMTDDGHVGRKFLLGPEGDATDLVLTATCHPPPARERPPATLAASRSWRSAERPVDLPSGKRTMPDTTGPIVRPELLAPASGGPGRIEALIPTPGVCRALPQPLGRLDLRQPLHGRRPPDRAGAGGTAEQQLIYSGGAARQRPSRHGPRPFQRCGCHWLTAVAGDDDRPELLGEPAALALKWGAGKWQAC